MVETIPSAVDDFQWRRSEVTPQPLFRIDFINFVFNSDGIHWTFSDGSPNVRVQYAIVLMSS